MVAVKGNATVKSIGGTRHNKLLGSLRYTYGIVMPVILLFSFFDLMLFLRNAGGGAKEVKKRSGASWLACWFEKFDGIFFGGWFNGKFTTSHFFAVSAWFHRL